MKTIITIQHTQSIHHTNGMVGSWTDWALTELGLEQAGRIAKRLREELSGRDFLIYSSDLLRAKQTAQTVAKALNVPIIFRKELRERNLGAACGHSVAWMHENMTAPEVTIDDRLFPDAESRREEWKRLRPFFDELMDSPQQDILLVSHGDILSVFNAMFMGLEPESMNHFEAFGLSGGVSFLLQNDSGKRFIKRLSDLSYIR